MLTADLEDEAVLLDLTSKRYYRLNPTAAAVWRRLQAGDDLDAVVRHLTAEFAVDTATAEDAVSDLVAGLLEGGLIHR